MEKVAYRKVYRLRPFGRGGYEVTVPGLILDRAARSKGMTIEQFVKTHRMVHLFNDFKGFDGAYRFEPTSEVLELSDEELRELGVEPHEETMAEKLARMRREIQERKEEE